VAGFLFSTATKGNIMAFNLADYQTVQERIEIFWRLYPDGRIFNDLVLTNEKEVIIKCSVWKNANQQLPDATDFAQESITATGITATSAVEVCSTSATGRALSLLGGELSPSKKRASQTEMLKAARSRDWGAELEACVTREECLALYSEAKALGVNYKIIDMIQVKGRRLAEIKNSPVGKEETTREQPIGSATATEAV
jgi:hypothetical protein